MKVLGFRALKGPNLALTQASIATSKLQEDLPKSEHLGISG